MDIFISDTSFHLVAIIDRYESFIWTERYSDYGDFELYLPMDSNAIQYLKADYYVEIRESDRTMIIEDIQIDTDVDGEPALKISGRSLESILDRRIIWKQTLISNKTVDKVIKQLLEENIMYTASEERRVEEFKNFESYVDSIDSLVISQVQFTGDNLYDAVKSLCDVYGLGFKIIAGSPEERDAGSIRFHFELFSGTNRSYTNDDGTDQLGIPHVVFSPNLDNLLNSSYFESHRNHKTIALVAGQGEGADRVMTETAGRDGGLDSIGKGLSRRELFVDARDLAKESQQQAEDGTVSTTTLSDDEYDKVLIERGNEKLAECQVTESFEGGVDPDSSYRYGSKGDVEVGNADYSIGDIVQVENEYGMSCRCRVTEFIRSKDAAGPSAYPTFAIV